MLPLYKCISKKKCWIVIIILLSASLSYLSPYKVGCCKKGNFWPHWLGNYSSFPCSIFLKFMRKFKDFLSFKQWWNPHISICLYWNFAVAEMEENLILFSVFHLSLYCLHRFDMNSWWNWKFFKLQPLVKVAGLYLFSFRFDGLSSHLLYLSSLLYLSTISDLFSLSSQVWTTLDASLGHLLALFNNNQKTIN